MVLGNSVRHSKLGFLAMGLVGVEDRVRQELFYWQNTPPEHCRAGPSQYDSLLWRAILQAPEQSCYKGGAFELEIHFPEEYPLSCPYVRFLTPVYHPNITRDGEISGVEVMGSSWQPNFTLEILIAQISLLLAQPNWAHKDALQYIINHHSSDKKGFEELARVLTQKYAMRLPRGAVEVDSDSR